MNLQEFVETTIKQIIAGVEASDVRNPNEEEDPRYTIGDVDFDVAVSVAESNEKEGSGNLKVLTGSLSSSKESSTVSRVRFTVYMPRGHEERRQEAEARKQTAVARALADFINQRKPR